MANPNRVTFSNFDAVLKDTLDEYHFDVAEGVDSASQWAVQELVRITKKTAPKKTGRFRKDIAWAERTLAGFFNSTYIWFVKAPSHRLTHLLVRGHPTGNGGRTKGDPFLENAMAQVLPEYEERVEDALKWGDH